MTSKTTMPSVEQLAQELAAGRSPVELYAAHTAAQLPAPSADELKAIQQELRARIQFAWEQARSASIENRVKA